MSDSVHVRVLCFSVVRDAIGQSEIELTLSAGATAQTVTERVRELGGARLEGLPLRLAVDQQFVSADRQVSGGEEIAVIPPVQGG